MQFVGNECPDHSRRLIRAFVAHLQNQWILYFKSMNRECLDQTAQMCMLIWTFAARIWHKNLFSTSCIICNTVIKCFCFSLLGL